MFDFKKKIFTHFEGVSVHISVAVGVEEGRDTAEHLEQERFPVQHVELLASEFDSADDEVVSLVVRVDSQHGGHDEKVSVVREDVLELVSRVDHRGQAVAQDAGVLGVQRQGAIDDVDEELDVGRVDVVAGHGLEHPRDQPDPVELVQHIESVHLLRKKMTKAWHEVMREGERNISASLLSLSYL